MSMRSDLQEQACVQVDTRLFQVDLLILSRGIHAQRCWQHVIHIREIPMGIHALL